MEAITLTLLFASITQTFDLPGGLISSLCYVESHHKVMAVHKDDGNSSSLGVCQIKLNTAKVLGFKGNEKQLMKPETNVYYAAKYLKKQITRYSGNIPKAIAAYNSGTYRENSKKVVINKQYVTKVLKAWQENR